MENLETKLLVYRQGKNVLTSINMPVANIEILRTSGKTSFKGVDYIKDEVISITRKKENNNTIKVTYSGSTNRIVCAYDSEKRSRHQPQYRDYGGGLLSDEEFLQLLKLRFGYINIESDKKIETVADSRREKNLEDAKADYQAKVMREKDDQRIQWLTSKVEVEKEAIKDCINQNFFDMAKSKLERIEALNEEILTLRSKS